MDYTQVIILFCVGTIAGFINVLAGGGSSLTLPTLIFMGLDGSLANGTNRVAVLIQNISAITSFRKEKYFQLKESLLLAIFTIPGAIAGSIAAVKVSDALFQRILAVILIFIVISFFFYRPEKNNRKNTQKKNWLIYPAIFGVGFYGGFLQVGVGIVLMAALFHLLRINLVLVNMHKVFIIMIYTIPVILVFSLSGNINWEFGLILAAGNAFGAWWGARMTIKGGEKLVRIVLAVVILGMSLKLFGLF